jgi:hypothetical protein
MIKKLLTFEQVETVLNELVEDYLEGVAQNTNEDGIINWGNGVLGYESEEQLLEDLITYIQNK